MKKEYKEWIDDAESLKNFHKSIVKIHEELSNEASIMEKRFRLTDDMEQRQIAEFYETACETTKELSSLTRKGSLLSVALEIRRKRVPGFFKRVFSLFRRKEGKALQPVEVAA